MDPVTASALTEAAKQGFSILLLVLAVVILVRWILGLEKQRTQREQDARKECLEREQTLAKRLQSVEDRQNGEASELLHRSVNALELNARAIDRLCDKDTGLHLALVDRREGKQR
jgi:glucose-6-phosphate-specific signal transduction histidine kinase